MRADQMDFGCMALVPELISRAIIINRAPKRDYVHILYASSHTNVSSLSPPAGPTHSRLILLMHARGPTMIKAGVAHKKRNTFSSTLSEVVMATDQYAAPVVYMDGPSCVNRLLISQRKLHSLNCHRIGVCGFVEFFN